MNYPPGVIERDINGAPMLKCEQCGQEHNGNLNHDRECRCEECCVCDECNREEN